MEQQPTSVLAKTKQVGEAPARWSWVEPTVWTERMLTTLETGVKGGKWFSLIDKVYSAANLASAFSEVRANDGAAGVDHIGVRDFEQQLESNLAKLHEQLRDGTYHPQAVRRVWIPKLGSAEKRPLGPCILGIRLPFVIARCKRRFAMSSNQSSSGISLNIVMPASKTQ